MSSVLAIGLLAACGDGQKLDTRPERVSPEDGPVFNSLATMTATSDLVVLAEPTAANPGDLEGEKDDEHAMRSREVSLRVLKTAYSKDGSAPTGVTLDELGWIGTVGTAVEGRPWTEVGRQGYFFLEKIPEDGHYVFVGVQGRILKPAETIGRAQLIEVSGTGTNLSTSVQNMNWDTVGTELTKVAQQVKQGKVKPKPMGDEQ